MKNLEFSQIARRKLKELKAYLAETYGTDLSQKKIGEIMSRLRMLQQHSSSGVRVAEMYDIETDYYYVFTNHNYFIYRIEEQKVIVVQMFNENQDFMQKLFGISGRTQASIDYWGD